MSSKTKIFVLKSRNLIWTAVIVVIVIVVCVDKNHINSIRAHNLAQSVATLYPLVPSVLQSLESQILSSQSLQGVTYSDSSQYTASLLIDAITRALKKSVTY